MRDSTSDNDPTADSWCSPGVVKSGGWRDLFNRHHRGAALALAGGVAIFATDIYVMTSLLPSAVVDIGGQAYYAWTMTVFLLTAVISSMFVQAVVRNHGPRTSYLVSFSVFAAGSVICAAAPTMAVMLVGRGIQGLGGGLLTGLAYAVLRMALPPRLWPRAIALISAMWGVGNLAGPVLGGLFAQIGFWPGAFIVLAVLAVVLCVVSQRALPRQRSAPTGERAQIPLTGLAILTVATAAISIASILTSTTAVVVLSILAVSALAGFVIADRRVRITVLPRFTYSLSSVLPWVYMTVAILVVGVSIETFVPLFGQDLGGMGPFLAGLLGASISWGWSLASIASTYAESRRAVSGLIVAGPVVLAVGLFAYGILQTDQPSVLVIVCWFIVLTGAGAGIGMAFAHLVTVAVSSASDEADAAKASAGLNTVQLIANTFGAALAGLLVAIGGPTVLGSARVLTFAFAVIAVIGVSFATVSARYRKPARSQDA